MLEADWEACERGYYAGELRIQEKELRLYTKCNAIIAKHAAFFALIAYSALSMTPHWLDEALTSQTKKFFFYNFVVVAIGFNMLTMVVTSWLSCSRRAAFWLCYGADGRSTLRRAGAALADDAAPC